MTRTKGSLGKKTIEKQKKKVQQDYNKQQEAKAEQGPTALVCAVSQ